MQLGPREDEAEVRAVEGAVDDLERVDAERLAVGVAAWKCGGPWSSKYIVA